MNTVAKTKTSPASSGNKEKEEVDRISKLPDEIIHYILSFIDPKFAVQTSVLSKRWIDIWKSLPFLNFNTRGYSLITWSDSIDRVFRLRDNCNIQRFRLAWNCLKTDDTTNVSRWIDFAVRCNLQELTLEVGQVYPRNLTYKIPPKLLNCKSLKKLTLRCRTGYLQILLPNSMCLPQLEYMCLDGIIMSDGELSTWLFSSCPLLETLKLVNYDIQTNDQKNFTLETLSLKKFSCSHSLGAYYLQKRNYKPKIIMVSAPNLTSLTYNYEVQIKNLSEEEKEVNAKCAVKLLVEVDKVERLDLSPTFIEVLSSATNLLNSQLHYLCNLQCLKMETRFTGGSLRVIAHLLTISPNIETLILKIKGPDSVGAGDVWEGGLSLPGTLSYLNFVRIEGMVGCDAEIKLMSFLLRNSKVLDEVDLFFCSSVGSPERERQLKQFRKKLKALPRASSNINIMVF